MDIFAPNRVLVVDVYGDAELYKPEGDCLEIDYIKIPCEYVEDSEFCGRRAVEIINFSGRIGIPRIVTFRVDNYFQGGSQVYGVVSGPGYIESAGNVELAYPEKRKCVAVGKKVFVNGKRITRRLRDDYDERVIFESEEGLHKKTRRKPKYCINSPRVIRKEGELRIQRSLSMMPKWASDEIVVADLNDALIIYSEGDVNLSTYSLDDQEDRRDSIPLYDYIMGCLSGIDPVGSGKEQKKEKILPEQTQQPMQPPSQPFTYTPPHIPERSSIWKRLVSGTMKIFNTEIF